jgi:ammonia channel protein AmtB
LPAHFAAAERIKALPDYIMCAGIGGVAYPFVLYFTWGSASPITARGTHDFIGVFVAYIFAGTFALMLARRQLTRRALAVVERGWHSRRIVPISMQT